MSDSELAESYMAKDGVLLHNRGDFGGPLIRLDAKTGEVLWRRNASWAVHPRFGLEPLWIVDNPPNENHDTMYRLDATTGAELERMRLDEPVSYLGARFVYANGVLLALSGGLLRGIEPSTGRTMWRSHIPEDGGLQAPLVSGSRVLFIASPIATNNAVYIAVNAGTGEELFRVDGACCSAAMSPDGQTLYVLTAEARSSQINWAGTNLAVIEGAVLDVSNRFVALQQTDRLAVYEHGSDAPTWTRPTTDEAYVSAVGLAGTDVFFFSGSDGTVWRRKLLTGRTTRIHKGHSKFVVGTEPGQTGLSGAHISVAPRWDPPYLYIYDWSLITYRLRR